MATINIFAPLQRVCGGNFLQNRKAVRIGGQMPEEAGRVGAGPRPFEQVPVSFKEKTCQDRRAGAGRGGASTGDPAPFAVAEQPFRKWMLR